MNEAKTEDKKRKFALYVHDSSLDVARQWYEHDNCASISEFIEKAILFYGGYVANERNQNYLPNIVISAIMIAYSKFGGKYHEEYHPVLYRKRRKIPDDASRQKGR